MRAFWALLGCAGCGVAGLGPAGGGAHTGTDATEDWPEAWAAFEAEVVELVNRERYVGATCGGSARPGGLPALEMDAVIRGTARDHSADMAARGFFDHRNPDGALPEDRMAADGFAGALPWGENIAAGAWDAPTVVQGWMDSPGHCANIMEPGFRVIGVGYVFEEDSDWGHYWTQVFAGSH